MASRLPPSRPNQPAAPQAGTSADHLRSDKRTVGSLFESAKNDAERAAILRSFAVGGYGMSGYRNAVDWLLANKFDGDHGRLNSFIKRHFETNYAQTPTFDPTSKSIQFVDGTSRAL